MAPHPAHHDRDRLLLDITSRATVDPAFRSDLLKDPNAAIYAAFGMRVPEGFRLRFTEKGPDLDALIVLPDPQRPNGVLADDDLDSVAGGTGSTDDW